MNNKIWKFPLEVVDKQLIKLPEGAEILSVQSQHGTPHIWALVDPEENKGVERTFHIFNTGDDVSPVERKFIGTYQLLSGEVYHLFEAL